MTQAVAATAPTSDKLDLFWPSPSPGDEDNLPDGTPLSIPPYAMQDEKEYTFTLMSVKSKRVSLPDMGVLSTANKTCPSAVIEPIRGRVNPQFLYRIYGAGASTLGGVQFKWRMVDTQPLSAPSLSAGAATEWNDKAYFSVAKDTLVAGREYKLTLNTRATATASDATACVGTAERIVLTNVEPRAIDGISFEPAAGGVEFNTSFTIECGQWVDTDDQLDYRLAYYYNLDTFNARWTWLTDKQVGVSTFEDVLLPHDSSNLGTTRVRCVAFDDDGAFGYSATSIPVAAHADLSAAIEEVFVAGDHTEHIQVFPAALRRMQQQDKARHAANTGRRRRGLLALTVGAELHKALVTVQRMLDRSAVPSPKLRDAALELMETYVATSASDASNLPAEDLTPVIARTAHDWPDGETEAGTAPGGAADGSWWGGGGSCTSAERRQLTHRA
jgi:hypothetical protein